MFQIVFWLVFLVFLGSGSHWIHEPLPWGGSDHTTIGGPPGRGSFSQYWKVPNHPLSVNFVDHRLSVCCKFAHLPVIWNQLACVEAALFRQHVVVSIVGGQQVHTNWIHEPAHLFDECSRCHHFQTACNSLATISRVIRYLNRESIASALLFSRIPTAPNVWCRRWAYSSNHCKIESFPSAIFTGRLKVCPLEICWSMPPGRVWQQAVGFYGRWSRPGLLKLALILLSSRPKQWRHNLAITWLR